MKARRPKPIRKPDDTLSPAEAKIVRRGEAQLRRGQSKRWRVAKHALRIEVSDAAEKQPSRFRR